MRSLDFQRELLLHFKDLELEGVLLRPNFASLAIQLGKQVGVEPLEFISLLLELSLEPSDVIMIGSDL